MIKKIFMCIMLVLAFTACQSLNYVKEKNETIQLVVKGNDNNIYMLGNNYDYQFSGKDADRLLRLSNFPKELNFSREQLKNASVNIHVDARNGSVGLDFGSRITINRKAGSNANYEKEQKVFYENLKNELNRRKVRYKIEENSVILSKYGFLKEHINLVNRYELTPEGHLFLADIKNDENWLKIKEISDKIGFSSLDSIKEIISYLRKSLINDCFITHI